MAWRNLKLFSVTGKALVPDSIMKKLSGFRFNGDEGINRFETWRDFDELRMEYLFRIPKFVRIAKLESGELKEDRVKIETFSSVDIHIKSSGLVEAYGSPVLIDRAVEVLSELGQVDPVVFGQKDFARVMKMSSDVRKMRIYGTDDEHVVEIILVGGGLSASKEMKKLRSRGKVREVCGKIELQDDSYGFTMTDSSVKFFVRDAEKAQNDFEYFISELLLS